MAADHIALYRRVDRWQRGLPGYRSSEARRPQEVHGFEGVRHNHRSIKTPGSVLVTVNVDTEHATSSRVNGIMLRYSSDMSE